MLARVRRAVATGELVACRMMLPFVGYDVDPATVDPTPTTVKPSKPETDFIDVLLTNGFDDAFDDEAYVLTLGDGTVEEGNLDGEGRLRKRGVPFGQFTLEFPNLFGMAIFRDGERISDPGRGTPPLLPSPPPEPDYEIDMLTVAPEDEDSHDHLPGDGGAVVHEPFDGPHSGGHDDEWVDHHNQVGLADLSGMTGCKYHLAVLYCISIRLVDRDSGAWVREPMPFRITDSSGKQVAIGESKEGIIFQDDTAMGEFALSIAGASHPIAASPDARHYDIVAISTRG